MPRTDEIRDLVAGGGHELFLGAPARAYEQRLGASSPQLVCDRQRRHDVPGGPAGRYHDSWHPLAL